MTTPRLHLETIPCSTCGAEILRADLDAVQHIWWHELRIDPHLLTPGELAQEILAGNWIYRIHTTKTGHIVAGRHHYEYEAAMLEYLERGRIKYHEELGYARRHIHRNPRPLTGPTITTEKENTNADLQTRLDVIAHAVAQHPELEQHIRDSYDPAPF